MHHLYRSVAALSTTFVFVLGCSSDPSNPSGNTGGAGGGGGTDESRDFIVGGARPVTVHVPPGVDPAKPAPLVILLHGFGASGVVQELVFRLEPESDARGFLYAHPEGTVNMDGKRFWNATDACCDFDPSNVDDVAYLTGLVAEIGQQYAVDPKRVFFTGHSNGGYMSHRLACDKPDLIAAIASLAGATWLDPTKCTAAEPISVLQIHGTNDDAVLYEGGANDFASYPGAVETVATWAAKNGCDATTETLDPIDLDTQLAGNETIVTRHPNCQPGGAAELWTIQGGTHIPGLGPNFAPKLIDWLFAHPKP